jgi:hypothetical protein
MEIHQSSLIYSPRNKSPQSVGRVQRADNKKPETSQQGVAVTISTNTNSSKDNLILTYVKQSTTKSGAPPLQIDTITNLRTQKALLAYHTEQNQIPQDHSTQLVSGVDYIV